MLVDISKFTKTASFIGTCHVDHLSGLRLAACQNDGRHTVAEDLNPRLLV